MPHMKLALILKGLKPILNTARVIAAKAIGILLEVDAILVRETQRLDEIVVAIEKE